MFYELLQLALGNLGRARARLAMTAGGVVVGTSAVVLLIALTIGLQAAAEAGIGNDASLTQIDVYPYYGPPTGDDTPVPQLDNNAIRAFWQIPGVQVVIPTVNLQGGQLEAGKYMGYASIQGVDPSLLPYMGLRVLNGELSLADGGVVAGSQTGMNFYDPNSSSEEWTPVQVDLMTEPLKLVLGSMTEAGVYRERRVNLKVNAVLDELSNNSDYTMYMDLQQVIRMNEELTGNEIKPEDFRYDMVTVRATSRETTNAVSEAIREMGFGAGGMGDYLNSLNSYFTTMRVMLGGIGGVALLVAAFGVANTMMMAILERTREIGLMKAIGATDRDVMTVFLIEAGLVGFVGGLAGIGLSYFLQNVVNQALQNSGAEGGGGMMFLPIDPSQIGGNLMVIPTELAVFAVLLATAVGLCAGFYPALRAAQMPPVIALKQE